MRWSFPIAFLCTVTLAASVLAAGGTPSPASKLSPEDLFARVLERVRDDYVDDVTERRLVENAVAGMMKSLDPYSEFLTREEMVDLAAETEGEFAGIGIAVGDDPNALVVAEAFPDTPARRAGLRPGDRIVAVDGAPTIGSGDGQIGRLRGAPGSRVDLTIARAAWASPRVFSLVREVIHVSAVESSPLDRGFGLVRVRQFQDGAAGEVAHALERLRSAAGGKLAGLVLDLRGNPGGLLEEAIAMADLFLARGIIVSIIGRRGQKVAEPIARGPGTWAGIPIVCLVDHGSASAAEIVAGALQDHGRALLVGGSTFGKGTVQSVYELDDGSGIKLTVARYLTPRGRSIQGSGIRPDVLVEPAVAAVPGALSAADPLLARALELLEQHVVESLEPGSTLTLRRRER